MSTMTLSKTWFLLILSLCSGMVPLLMSVAEEAPTAAVIASPTSAPITPVPTAFGWKGCEPQGTAAGETVPVEIGSSTTVCFHVGGGETRSWSDGVQYLRYVFSPKADEFSRYHIPYSYKNMIQLEPTSSGFRGHKTIGAASQSQISFLRGFFDHELKRIFPYLTIIIDVKNGIVQGITWDEACLFCGANRCVENTYDYNGFNRTNSDIGQHTKGCYFEMNECEEAITKDNDSEMCDITISVAWTGTDKNGQNFQSSASRYSLFPVQSVTDQLSQFTNFF